MKPCSKNRQKIMWLALGELPAGEASTLNAHLQECDECSRYLAEISSVTEMLAAAGTGPAVHESELFHRRLVARLKAEEQVAARQSLATQLRAAMANWRVALPLATAAILAIVGLPLLMRQPDVSVTSRVDNPHTVAPIVKSDLLPSMANYRIIANQSLDKLDELLIKQGYRSSAPTRTYSALSGGLD